MEGIFELNKKKINKIIYYYYFVLKCDETYPPPSPLPSFLYTHGNRLI